MSPVSNVFENVSLTLVIVRARYLGDEFAASGRAVGALGNRVSQLTIAGGSRRGDGYQTAVSNHQGSHSQTDRVCGSHACWISFGLTRSAWAPSIAVGSRPGNP